MKKISILILMVAMSFGAQAQFKILKLGAKGGFNYPQGSFDLQDIQAIINDPNYAISDVQTEISNGFNFGGVARIQLPLIPAYIQGEALYTQYGESITLVDGNQNITMDNTVQRLDFPISAGMKFGPAYAGLGATPTIPFANASDMWDDNTQASFTYGWHIHAGLKVWRLLAEIKYEGGFGPLARDVSFNYNNTDYNFNLDARSNQLILSVGYFFEN
ncbi:MAG: hypothetical protein RL754_530 [Bacteroidota bacterium]|jgi:hypothetical protein